MPIESITCKCPKASLRGVVVWWCGAMQYKKHARAQNRNPLERGPFILQNALDVYGFILHRPTAYHLLGIDCASSRRSVAPAALSVQISGRVCLPCSVVTLANLMKTAVTHQHHRLHILFGCASHGRIVLLSLFYQTACFFF